MSGNVIGLGGLSRPRRILDDFLNDMVIDTSLTAIRSSSKNKKSQYHYSVVKDRRGLRFTVKAQRQARPGGQAPCRWTSFI
jgi:hypothetical protein